MIYPDEAPKIRGEMLVLINATNCGPKSVSIIVARLFYFK